RLALGWKAFRRERLNASRLFELAGAGKLAAFERELELYPADDQWLSAARLVASWLAADVDRAAANELRRRARTESYLDERIDALFENRPTKTPAIDVHVTEQQVEEIIAQTGGVDAERVNPSMLWDQSAPPPPDARKYPGRGLSPEGT